MDWLKLLREALDEEHRDHDEGCDCYERLCDGLDGVYRFPEHRHGPVEPPVYGCKTRFEAMNDEMHATFIESFNRDLERLVYAGGS